MRESAFPGMQQRNGRCPGSGSHFCGASDFLSSESHRKPVFLVDSIMELSVNDQKILGVWSLSYLRNNDEILFLSGSHRVDFDVRVHGKVGLSTQVLQLSKRIC